MARLTTKQRDALPAKDFAEPGRSYPIPDRAHAEAAKGRAAEYASPSLKAKVDAKADAKLGQGKDRNANRTADRVVARLSKSKPVR